MLNFFVISMYYKTLETLNEDLMNFIYKKKKYRGINKHKKHPPTNFHQKHTTGMIPIISTSNRSINEPET